MQLTNLPIKSMRIGKDNLTGTSRGVCYVEMNSVVDSMFLHNQLLGEPPVIDDKLVSVSYYRQPMATPHYHRDQHHHQNTGNGNNSGGAGNGGQPTAAANAALAAAQWSHQGRQGIASQYSHEEIERMAEYSASLYAKTSGEKAHYLEYYRNYYKNGGDPNGGQKLGSPAASAAVTSSAPTAQPSTMPTIASASDSKKKTTKDLGKVVVNGVEYPRYGK
jgi:RNA-binding protein 5/10